MQPRTSPRFKRQSQGLKGFAPHTQHSEVCGRNPRTGRHVSQLHDATASSRATGYGAQPAPEGPVTNDPVFKFSPSKFRRFDRSDKITDQSITEISQVIISIQDRQVTVAPSSLPFLLVNDFSYLPTHPTATQCFVHYIHDKHVQFALTPSGDRR